jgi:hypothetical protein
MAQRAGWEARVKINTIFYAVKRWRVESAASDQDVSNSEGVPGNASSPALPQPGYSSSLGGLSKGTFTLTSATFDDEDNPFAAPLLLNEGDWAEIEIFPAGAAGPRHYLANALITRLTNEGEVDGLSPVTIEGVTDGAYQLAK